jgi:type I restriction enzyme S subunit
MKKPKEQYKQTEFGKIPVDWDLNHLGELGKFSKGSGVKKDETTSGDLPCIRYGELYTKHGEVIRQFYSFISREVSSSAKRLKTGDILFAGSGETKADIGKTAAFIDNIEAYAGGDIVIFSPNTTDSKYLGYLLNADFVQSQKASKGQGDAVVHISASQIATIKIPLPPTLAEQKAIATVLSDTDDLIRSLEQLIEKKKAIKQGVMQELLRPKKGWVVRKLGDVAEITMGQSPSSSNYNTEGKGLPLIQGNADINERKTIIRTYTSITTKLGKKGDIIMSVRAPVGEIAKTDFNCCLGRGVCSIRYKNDFLYYCLINLENSWFQFSSGSTFDSVNSAQVKNLAINLPGTENEELETAGILSDSDDNINELCRTLWKYKQIKNAMMQNLLTGKTRLI